MWAASSSAGRASSSVDAGLVGPARASSRSRYHGVIDHKRSVDWSGGQCPECSVAPLPSTLPSSRRAPLEFRQKMSFHPKPPLPRVQASVVGRTSDPGDEHDWEPLMVQMLFAARRLGVPADAAEDVVQRALERMIQGFGRFDGRSLTAWAGAMVMYGVRSWRRRRSRSKIAPGPAGLDPVGAVPWSLVGPAGDLAPLAEVLSLSLQRSLLMSRRAPAARRTSTWNGPCARGARRADSSPR